ncbi:MAG: Gfo/Idh/MocA family oxidoreductase [Pirellulales bacterium]
MIRIGIVGCGRILAAHLRGYRLLREAGFDGFRITALCARNERDALMYVRRGQGPPQRDACSSIAGDPLAVGDEYLSDFQATDDVAVYTDYREMMATAPIDAVNDLTTHALHHQVAAAAFSAGKHLMSQKPLAVSVRAARKMCDEADARGLTFGVFECFRYMPETRRLKWWFVPERGGRLQMLLVGYIGAWWAPDFVVAHTPWRHVREEGGGISLDLGVHFFDQIRHLAGEIHTVSAQTAVVEPRRRFDSQSGRSGESIACDADDTCFVAFDTEAGAVGQISASWAGHGEATVLGEGSVFYGERSRTTGDRLSRDDGTYGSLAEVYATESSVQQRGDDFPLGLSDSFALAQYDWLRAAAAGEQPETSGREGLRDLAAAFAILESARAGCRVAVADVLDGTVDAYQRPIDERFGLI